MAAPFPFPYTLIRSRQRKRTLSLELRRDDSFIVRAPALARSSDIATFLVKKRNWAARKLAAQAALRPTAATHDHLRYLGVPYPLHREPQASMEPSLAFAGAYFVLRCDEEARRAEVITDWYRRQAATYLASRTTHWAAVMGFMPPGLRISNATRSWGACSPHNRISLSWRLLMALPAVIDYVVVHELAHLQERNHGPGFWRLVAAVVGDTAGPRRWLRENGPFLWP